MPPAAIGAPFTHVVAVTGAVAGARTLNGAPPSTESVIDVTVTASKLVFSTSTVKVTGPPGSGTESTERPSS